MKTLFRIVSAILIFVLAAYLFVILGPVKEIIKHRIETALKTKGIAVEIGSLDTDLFTTVVLKNLRINYEGFGSFAIDKLVIRYNPLLFFNKKFSGYAIDKKLNALFLVELDNTLGAKKISFRVFPGSPLKLRDFLGSQFSAIGDMEIFGETAVFGEIVFNNAGLEFSLDVILSAAGVISEKSGLYISGISGNIPFTSGNTRKGEGIFIRSVKAGDVLLENLKGRLMSQNSLLNFDSFEYNMYNGKGKGSASFSVKGPSFRFDSKIEALDLERFDNASKGFKTKTEGVVDLDIVLVLKGTALEILEVKANSDKTGKIKQEVILALLNYLPKDNQTTQLVNELLKEKEFIYNRLNGEFAKGKEGYKMHLVLDGTHFLEFNINIDEVALGTLLGLFK